MNLRERTIETLTFGSPDRVPFEPGRPRESTLANWRKEGLPEGANWFEYLIESLGIEYDWPTQPKVDPEVDFRLRPRFEEKIIEHRQGTYIVQDWKGNICEISDRFDPSYLRQARDFVTRRWIKCPVANREDWEAIKTRYDADDAGRIPEDFEARCAAAKDRDYVLSLTFSGPFWQMREWCGFEGLCMMMIDQPDLVAEMASFWTDFVSALFDRILPRLPFDHIRISEDMAYKAKSMISPAMTREFCKPSWVRWSAQLKEGGVPVVDLDSDGYIGNLIPIWIESGLHVCSPMEVAANNDINQFREQFGREMAYRGGIDKRAMAAGGAAIRAELKRNEPVVRDGGFIPGCDHGIPNNVSWPDFVDFCRLLAEMTGWL